jgi:hypothetical protein
MLPVEPGGAGISAEMSTGGAALASRGKNGHLRVMSTVAEIEAAIEKLPPTELSELLAWLEEYRAMTGASDALFAMYDEEEL